LLDVEIPASHSVRSLPRFVETKLSKTASLPNELLMISLVNHSGNFQQWPSSRITSKHRRKTKPPTQMCGGQVVEVASWINELLMISLVNHSREFWFSSVYGLLGP